MAAVHILGGDFGENLKAQLSTTRKTRVLIVPKGLLRTEKIDLREELERVEVHDQESVKKLTFTRVALVGIFALALRKKKSTVVFAGYLKDGRKFLATTDEKTFRLIQAVAF